MILNFDDAKQTILQHAGHVDLPGRSSLIGSLRPYSGISEDDFQEIIVSLISLHDDLAARDLIDRGLVYGCWDLCSRIHTLALRENAPLRTNKLITSVDFIRIREWHRSIESYCMACLHQLDLGTCLGAVIEYVGSDACPDAKAYRDFASLFESLIADADFELRPLIEQALARIGSN